jgi:putative ABC transport system permease protein
MEEVVGRQTANGRFASSVLLVFAMTALTLTAVGLYAVLAYLVSLRRREIGIRIALGATPDAVMRRVIGHGMTLIGTGALVGLFVAIGVTRWISSQLFGVNPNDGVVLVTVTATLLAIAALASWLPARRASTVDPQVALRME